MFVEGVSELLGKVASSQLFLHVAMLELESLNEQAGCNVGINGYFMVEEPFLLEVNVVDHRDFVNVFRVRNRMEVFFNVSVNQFLDFHDDLVLACGN